MITIKESRLSKNGQVTLPVHFRKFVLQNKNSVFVYQTELDGVQCLILSPTNIDQSISKNLLNNNKKL